MALEKVSMQCEFIKWTDDMEGQLLQLYYLETKKGGLYNSITHYVKSAETGKIYGLTGVGQLNWLLEKTLHEAGGPRFYFELVYQGRDESKAEQFGGNAPCNFDYWQDITRFDPAVGGEQGVVKYKNGPAAASAAPAQAETPAPPVETAPPPLAKPEPVPQQPAAAPAQPAAAPAQPAPAAAPKAKRAF